MLEGTFFSVRGKRPLIYFHVFDVLGQKAVLSVEPFAVELPGRISSHRTDHDEVIWEAFLDVLDYLGADALPTVRILYNEGYQLNGTR